MVLLSSFLVFVPFAMAIIREKTIKDGMFQSVKGMVLLDHVISTHHVTSPIDCSFQCSSVAECKSYNYKPRGAGAGQDVCQLNNATRQTNPASYKADAGYVHYFDQSEAFASCLDYLRQGVRKNGIYTLKGPAGNPYPAFCDFTSEPRSAWTLVLSFSRKNRNKYAFCKASLESNHNVNKNFPNWESYRLQYKRMQLISSGSTHFRATTDFEKDGVDFTDYLRAKISKVDVLNSGSILGACKKVEYINIRGIIGINVQAPFWNAVDRFVFHTDASSTACSYNAKPGSLTSENNFGFYCEGDSKMNLKFRGTADDESTTQYWFGGYL